MKLSIILHVDIVCNSELLSLNVFLCGMVFRRFDLQTNGNTSGIYVIMCREQLLNEDFWEHSRGVVNTMGHTVKKKNIIKNINSLISVLVLDSRVCVWMNHARGWKNRQCRFFIIYCKIRTRVASKEEVWQIKNEPFHAWIVFFPQCFSLNS